MAEKKAETKSDKVEREYVIPLRKKYQHVARYKKTPKAIKTVKEFLARHFRIENRDLKNVRLDKLLNEFLWARGIKNPPHKVKVKAVKEGDIVRAELVDYPTKLKFKKARQEKAAKAQEDLKEKKKSEAKPLADAAKKETKNLEDKTKEEKDSKEEKEKKTSIVEAGEKRAKSEHTTEKHQTQAKAQKSKRPVRQSMQK
tara:strand:- start:685 stop:1281 length:597 start_codon:yes stop_codon:yes gene_type:complete